VLDLQRQFPLLAPDSQQARDIGRFARIAQGLVVVDPSRAERIVELRYSMVPHEIAGFWAIEIDPSAPVTAHVELIATREHVRDEGRRFLALLASQSGTECNDGV
jgi:inner membrane protein